MAGFISKRSQAIANGTSYKNTEALENQHATHRDILKFGNKIYERKCAELEKLREESLAELEVRLWQIANEERDQAVKETFEQGQQELKQSEENAKKEKNYTMKGSAEKARKKHDVVVPGEHLGSADEYKFGEGTYERLGHVYANRAGYKVVKKLNENDSVICVVRDKHSQVLPTIGAVVTAKVTAVNTRFCKLAMLAVEGCPLNEPFRGTLRKEDIRATEKDKVEIYKSFRPGDIVQARVSSLGDSHSYSLSTAENELGVIFAMSEAGASMIPISWKEMQCSETKAKEFRKVAKVQQQ